MLKISEVRNAIIVFAMFLQTFRLHLGLCVP